MQENFIKFMVDGEIVKRTDELSELMGKMLSSISSSLMENFDTMGLGLIQRRDEDLSYEIRSLEYQSSLVRTTDDYYRNMVGDLLNYIKLDNQHGLSVMKKGDSTVVVYAKGNETTSIPINIYHAITDRKKKLKENVMKFYKALGPVKENLVILMDGIIEPYVLDVASFLYLTGEKEKADKAFNEDIVKQLALEEELKKMKEDFRKLREEKKKVDSELQKNNDTIKELKTKIKQ